MLNKKFFLLPVSFLLIICLCIPLQSSVRSDKINRVANFKNQTDKLINETFAIVFVSSKITIGPPDNRITIIMTPPPLLGAFRLSDIPIVRIGAGD